MTTYTYGLRGSPLVGSGVPGLPAKVEPRKITNVGDIAISSEAPSSGEWLPLDGSAWDDRLDATDIAGGSFYVPSTQKIVATGQDGLLVDWLPNDAGFITYHFPTKSLRRYLLDESGGFALYGSLTLSDMTVVNAPTYPVFRVRPDGLQVAIHVSNTGDFRVYDIADGFLSATLKIAYTKPASLTGSYVNRGEYSAAGDEFVYSGVINQSGAEVAFVSVDKEWINTVPVLLSPQQGVFSSQILNLLFSSEGNYAYKGYTTSSGATTVVCRYKRSSPGVYTKLGESTPSSFTVGSQISLTQDGELLVQTGASSSSPNWACLGRSMRAGDDWTGVWNAATDALLTSNFNAIGITYKSGAIVSATGTVLEIKKTGDGVPNFSNRPESVSFSLVSNAGKYGYRVVSGTFYLYKVSRPVWNAFGADKVWVKVG